MRLADAGISELQRYVDTLIVIPNQNLFRVANERTTFTEAFAMADQVLHSGVRSITDLMVLPGLINLDFADVRTVMTEMGKAMMGTGEASGEGRALMAAENAIQNPLLDEVTLKGAKAVLVNITGGLDMTLLEVDEAANAISAQVDPEANIIFGAAFDPGLQNTLRVSVVATGMDGASIALIEPAPMRRTSARAAMAEAAAAQAAAAAVPPMPAPAPIPEPVLALEPEPVMAAPEPEPMRAYVPEPAPYVPEPEPQQLYEPPPQPRVFEPLRGPYGARATADRASDGNWELPSRRTAPEPVAAYEEPAPIAAAPPPVVETRPRQPTVTRIVDPSVEDEEGAGPLFPETAHYNVDRRPKGGFFSMFNKPKHDAHPHTQLRRADHEPTVQPIADPPADADDDLEIPSFLRRLAN
jgi:cell division protein FtsZ